MEKVSIYIRWIYKDWKPKKFKVIYEVGKNRGPSPWLHLQLHPLRPPKFSFFFGIHLHLAKRLLYTCFESEMLMQQAGKFKILKLETCENKWKGNATLRRVFQRATFFQLSAIIAIRQLMLQTLLMTCNVFAFGGPHSWVPVVLGVQPWLEPVL